MTSRPTSPAASIVSACLDAWATSFKQECQARNSGPAVARGKLLVKWEIPDYALVLSDDTLYGTASFGGDTNNGTIFQIRKNGNGFTNIHKFSNSDGADPTGLTFSAGTLYGVTAYGGSSGYGTVFAVNTDGTDFTNLHNFAGYPNDGTGPYGGLN